MSGFSDGSPPSAAHRPSGRFYRPELDALRFVAFCMVFCAHAGFRHLWLLQVANVGGFGVQIFFCLSAFLIVSILLREREQTGTVRLGAFAVRRMLRIWPLYFAVVAYGWWLPSFPMELRKTAVLQLLLMVGNLFALHHGFAAMGLLAPLWSISIEEQFYLGVPMLAKLGGKRAIWLACLATLIVSYGMLVILDRWNAIPDPQVWVNSLVQFQFFAAGGILALTLYGRTVRMAWPLRILLAAMGAYLMFWAATDGGIRWIAPMGPGRLVEGYVPLLLATSLILLSAIDLPYRSPRPLVYLGKISYGLYLLHLPVYAALLTQTKHFPAFYRYIDSHHASGLVIWFLATIALAAVSYEFFEKPFLKLKRRYETVVTRPV